MTTSSTHEELELELVVRARTALTPEIVELEFEDSRGANLPAWDAGSHADLLFGDGYVRQYSIVRGALDESNWRMAILADSNGRGGSRFLAEHVSVGTVINAKGPRNHFALLPAPMYHFIAGGIGITPILSMIDAAQMNGVPWTLSYLGRAREAMAYVSELEAKFPDKVSVFAKSEENRFDVEGFVDELSADTQTYACGPEKLLIGLEQAFAAVGNKTLHIERFHPKEIILDEPDHEFQVYCAKSEIEITVAADESILMAADAAGVDITGDCMEGTCGACETKVISGDVSHRDSIMTEEQQVSSGTMMICVSRARASQLTLDL
jgi:ferredoxin-NADP reductase